MALRRLMMSTLPAVLGMYMPFCTASVRLTPIPADAPPATLWEQPAGNGERDLFYGPWGREHAPSPNDIYTLVQVKHSGINPGLTVRDSEGREWSVKQPFSESDDEGPTEVVLSRVLSAVLPALVQAARRLGSPHGARWTLPFEDEGPEGPRRVVMAAEPVRRDAAIPGAAGHSAGLQQFRP